MGRAQEEDPCQETGPLRLECDNGSSARTLSQTTEQPLRVRLIDATTITTTTHDGAGPVREVAEEMDEADDYLLGAEVNPHEVAPVMNDEEVNNFVEEYCLDSASNVASHPVVMPRPPGVQQELTALAGSPGRVTRRVQRLTTDSLPGSSVSRAEAEAAAVAAEAEAEGHEEAEEEDHDSYL